MNDDPSPMSSSSPSSLDQRDANLYAPPSAPLDAPQGDTPGAPRLASRWRRFFGAWIDSLIIGSISVGLQGWLGYLDGFPHIEITLESQIVAAALGIATYVLINGYFLRDGQTLGKRLLHMRIVTLDGAVASPPRIIGLRLIPITLLGSAPQVGPLISLIGVLLIFGAHRRCLHDYFAGTAVVEV